MVALRDGLAGAGLTVITFAYPYSEAGRRRPDRPDVLLACHRAVLERVRSDLGGEVVLGGRSMGGRMASHLAAEGEACAGLVCYAYPLHPPGRPDRLRREHLTAISVPVLMVRGSRDAFSRADLFDEAVRPLPGVTVVDLEGADHGFRGRGWTPERVTRTLVSATAAWIEETLGIALG